MEEMLELLEKILKGSVPAVAVGGCIFLFGFMKFQKIAATPREGILFMSKKDKLIKDTYAYLILFIVYSLKNMMFAYIITKEVCPIYISIYFFVIVATIIIAVISKNNEAYILLIISTGALLSPLIKILYEVNNIAVIEIVTALAETFLCEMILNEYDIKVENKADFYIIESENTTPWYVYRRLDEKYMLCGDNADRRECSKVKQIEYNPKLIFYRVEDKQEEKDKKIRQMTLNDTFETK